MFYVRDDRLRLVIEKTRQNIRYLSSIKLPPNVRPVSVLNEAIAHGDILVFVIPHEYIRDFCFLINETSITARVPIGKFMSKMCFLLLIVFL